MKIKAKYRCTCKFEGDFKTVMPKYFTSSIAKVVCGGCKKRLMLRVEAPKHRDNMRMVEVEVEVVDVP